MNAANAGAESFDYQVSDGVNTVTETVNLTIDADNEASALAHGFVSTWNVTGNSLTLPFGNGDVDFTVYWGDGTSSTHTGGTTVQHNYAVNGHYTVAIVGDFPGLNFNGGGDRLKLDTIEQWGNIAWQDLDGAFQGTNGLEINAVDAPDLSDVTDLSNLFLSAINFNADIGHWDVSNITDMSQMFFSPP